MAEPKTKPTQASVKEFLNQIPDEERREDCFAVAKIMEEITGEKPKMWGPSIVGFGTYHYKYASGREGDWPVAAFSPRKKDLTVYLMMGFEKHHGADAEVGQAQHRQVVPLHQTTLRYSRADTQEVDQRVIKRFARLHESIGVICG